MEYNSRIKRMDVMLIDPDKVSRGNLGALVRDFGCYLVRPFDDVEKAVVSIISKPPAIVICNWDAGEQISLCVLKQTRSHGNDMIARTPIVLMSRNLERLDMSKCLLAGTTQFLASPVIPADLMKKMVFILKDQRQMIRKDGRLIYVAAPRSMGARPKPSVKIMEFTATKSASKPNTQTGEQKPSAHADTKKAPTPAPAELPDDDDDDILEL